MILKRKFKQSKSLLIFGALLILQQQLTSAQAIDCRRGQFLVSGSSCYTCDASCGSCYNQQACIDCRPGWGKVESNGVGLCQKCPAGKYVSAQGFCTTCAPHCAECINGFQCTKCKEPFQINPVGNCISCGSGSFYNNDKRICQGCPENCNNCLNENFCVDCIPGFGKNAYSSKPEVCGTCENGRYLDGQQCKMCVKNCNKCDNPFTCKACISPFQVATEGKNIGKCVMNCGAEKFFDYQSGTCQACASNCNDCKDRYSCQKCNSGFARDIENAGTCYKCPPTETFLNNKETCEACGKNCLKCQSGTKCTQCKAPHQVNINGDCVVCKEGDYFDTTERVCKTCHKSCSTCTSSDACDSCAFNYLSQKLTISPSLCVHCTGANYLEGNVCKPCSKNCLKCLTGSQCDVCDKSTILNADGDCVKCAHDTFFDSASKRCTKCNPMATTCSSRDVHTSCQVGAYLKQDVTSSTAPALLGHGHGKCTECQNDCHSCSGDGQACDTCMKGLGRRADLDSKRCYACTEQQFLITGTQECKTCSENCVLCKSASQCQTCKSPFLADAWGNCIKCSEAEYFEPTQKVCRACHASCSSCKTGDACSTCETGYVSHSLTISPALCVQCTGNNYLEGNVCKRCTKDCKRCTNGLTCDQCQPGTLFDVSVKQCVICASDEYFNKSTRRCTKCGPLSKTCSSETVHTSCEVGAFLDMKSSTCKKCLNDCQSCSGDGLACDSCKAGLGKRQDLDPARCYSCTAQQFLTGSELCKTCSPNCIDCSSPTSCSSCKLPYKVDMNGGCVKCEFGEYFNQNLMRCDPCHKSCETCSAGEACSTCKTGYVSHQLTISPSLCVKCTGDNYLNGNVCKACSENCVSCKIGEKCDQCKAPTLLNADGKCVTCKSDEYFDENAKRCKQCGPLTTECADGSFGIAAKACQEGAYLDRVSNQCKPCQSDCQSCSDDTSCDTCKAGLGKRIDLDKKRCYKCTAEQFLTKEQECTMCSTNCEKCADESTCAKCESPFNSNSNGKCITCGAGQYFHKSMKTCVTCHESCETCTNGESCTKCSSGYLSSQSTISNQLCIKCTGPYFLDGNHCKKCSPNCQQCTNGNSCQQCQAGFALSRDSQCITCLKGSYFNSNSKTCEKCGPLCTACENGDTCTECKAGAALDKESKQCESCPYDCDTCSDQNTCTSCKADFGRRPGSDPNRCYTCSAGQYLEDQQCKACSSNCVSCSNPQQCTFCQTPFKIGYKGDCINCTGATFFDKAAKSCQNCAWNCESCEDKNSCDRCKNGFAKKFNMLNTDVCQKCPRGQYATKFVAEKEQVCKGCQKDCAECDDGETCKVCASGFELSKTGGCLACQPGTFYNSEKMTCQKCDSTCKTCSGPAKCDSCVAEFGKFEGSKLCQTCPSGTYLKDEVCKGCGKTCQECTYEPSNESGIQCTKCDGNYKISYTGLCVSSDCGVGKFFDDVGSKRCETCRQHCSSCSNENNCLDCMPGFGKNSYLKNPSYCYECATSEWLDGQVCTKCADNCRQCINGNRCSACEPGLVLVNGKCEFCKVNGEFFNEDTGTCDACDTSCDKCTDSSKCTKCKAGQGWLGKKSTCLPPPSGYFLQTQSSIIQPCSSKFTSCSSCTEDKCLTCQSGFDLSADGICIRCQAGKFFDERPRQCQTCTQNCKDCDREEECKTCEAGYGKNSKAKDPTLCYQCGYDQYLQGQECMDCSANCDRCINSKGCLKCKKGYEQDGNGVCVKCAEGHFWEKKTKTCRQCDASCESCKNGDSCDKCAGGMSKLENVVSKCYNCMPHQKITAQGCMSCGDACNTCSLKEGKVNDFCQVCVKDSTLTNDPKINRYTLPCTCNVGFGLRKASQPEVPDTCAKCSSNCEQCSFKDADGRGECLVCADGYVVDEETQGCTIDTARLNLIHEDNVYRYSVYPLLGLFAILVLLAICACMGALIYGCCKKNEPRFRESSNQVDEPNEMGTQADAVAHRRSIKEGNTSSFNRSYNNSQIDLMDTPHLKSVSTPNLNSQAKILRKDSQFSPSPPGSKLRQESFGSPVRKTVEFRTEEKPAFRSAAHSPTQLPESNQIQLTSEESQANYRLNALALPDHDHAMSTSFKNEVKTGSKRGASPHFSYRNRRDVIPGSSSRLRSPGAHSNRSNDFALNLTPAGGRSERSDGAISMTQIHAQVEEPMDKQN